MLKLCVLLALLYVIQVSVAPPVTTKKPNEGGVDNTEGLEDYVEYHRYIKQVVKALESDPAFREKLEKANDADIRNGKIASELELVSHNIRSKLDEIKRIELQRLRELAAKRDALMNNELDSDDPMHHHLQHENPHTFEVEDLKRLIVKTTEDLAEADRKRRDEFKEYELQKEYEKFEKLNHTADTDERHKLEEQFKEMDEKHKKHEKLHTPGHKQQLEEVWEEQDHMTQDFNPKTFFMLHDLDGNGLWDQDEVKALFVKELDKMYASGAPEDDMRERIEEMERMREAVFKEIDTNRDGFIDFNEFVQQTKKNNFDKDPGWKGLDEQKKPYTDEELEEYVRRQHEQQQYYQNMQGYPQGYPSQGHPPPYHHQQGAYPPQGHPQGYPQQGHPQDYPQQGHPQGYPQQGHPQGYPQQGHPQGYPQQGHPQGYAQQGHPQDYPQQEHPQGYLQQGHQQGHSAESAHRQPQGVPQGHPNQGGQFHPGQIPQSQVHPQQINQMQDLHPNDLNTNEVYNQPPQAAQQQNSGQKYPQQPPQQQQNSPPVQQKPANPPVNGAPTNSQQKQQPKQPQPPQHQQKPKVAPVPSQQQQAPPQQQRRGSNEVPQQQRQKQAPPSNSHQQGQAIPPQNLNAIPKKPEAAAAPVVQLV